MDNPPREEVEFGDLYGSLMTPHTPLFVETFDSRLGQSSVGRLPFAIEKSGFTWLSRLEEARESLPKASFRPTRPKIYTQGRSEDSITVLNVEVPQKRGRGRPKKQSTAVVDAAAVNRNSFFVKRSYSGDESHHNAEIYRLHGHGGAKVAADRIGCVLPELHYLRNFSEAPLGVEYDLDDQDVEWLKLVNSSGNGLIQLTDAQLEQVIEELELGWNALTQPIRRLQQRKEAALYPEEMPCEICGESDTSNCNVIVLCDDCDLAVHQECYGVPHIPEGPWLCRTCTDRARSNYAIKPKCLMCPWPGSALRKTTDHRWVHSLCAHMIPETAITFSPSEPNELVDVCTLQSDRAKLKCVLCRTDHARGGGYPMQCASKLCPVAFHPLCARAAGWSLDYSKQKGFCGKHLPEDALEHSNVTEATNSLKLRLNLNLGEKEKCSNQLVLPLSDDESSFPNSSSSRPSSPRSSGSGSPKKNQFPFIEISDTPPLHFSRGSGEKLRLQTVAPAILVKHVALEAGIFDSQIPSQARIEIVQKIARYWSLKRESRRGTPLLKTLQLEPCWTDSNTSEWDQKQFEVELECKESILHELHRVRDMFKILKKREQVKADIARCSASIFQILAQPFSRLCSDFVLNLMKKVDRSGYFTHPVPVDLFPDYLVIVKHPMDFSTILKQITADRNASPSTSPGSLFYPTLAHLYADLRLIPENARLYNTTTSVFYLAADRLETYMKSSFETLQQKLASYSVSGPFDSLNLEANGASTSFNWDEFLENLPQPTPARFEKPPPNPALLSSSSKSSSMTLSASGSTMKRRGRPLKNRNSSSFGSAASSESVASASSSSSTAASSASSDSIPKIRGRPPKLSPIVFESEEENEKVPIGMLNSERKLCWVKTSEDVWWPARVVDPNDEEEAIPANFKRLRPRAATASWLCQAFDPEKQWLWVAKEEAVDLTESLEQDLEELQYSPRNRKLVASAHRAAMEQAKL